jgi:hypothetical protein
MMFMVGFSGTVFAEDGGYDYSAEEQLGDVVSAEDQLLDMLEEEFCQDDDGEDEQLFNEDQLSDMLEDDIDHDDGEDEQPFNDDQPSGMSEEDIDQDANIEGGKSFGSNASKGLCRLNGRIVKHPHKKTIWLIEGCKKRAIPSLHTFFKIFKGAGCVESAYWIRNVPKGPSLRHHTHLMKGSGPAVYVLDRGIYAGKGTRWSKRPIPSPNVFNKYCFDWNKIITYPDDVIDSIPTGRVWW